MPAEDEVTHRNTSTGAVMPTTSVVLATYNGEQYLREQLESLGRQSRLPDQMIIVDDASTDSTSAIIRAFSRKASFPVEVVLQPEHLGTCATFEEGLLRATGEVIFICDQDDRWAPEKVAVMAERMANHQEVLLAFSDALLVDGRGEVLSRSRWRVAGFGPEQRFWMTEDPLGQILARQIVSGCTAVIRRELVPALLPFPGDLHPALGEMMYDRWMSLVAAGAGGVLTVPERLVEYRIHPGQQIGIPGLPVRRVAPRASLRLGQFVPRGSERTGRSEYHLAHLEEIEKRLDSAGMLTGEAELRLRLAKRHLEARATMEGPRWRRVTRVGRQMLDADGYRRFSLGGWTALADWVR